MLMKKLAWLIVIVLATMFAGCNLSKVNNLPEAPGEKQIIVQSEQPIEQQVQEQPDTKAAVPILIGESFNEVTAAMGRVPNETRYGMDLGWTYHEFPLKDYDMCFQFDNEIENSKVEKAICFIPSEHRQPMDNIYPVFQTRPNQIIPKKIWDQTPVGIYRGEYDIYPEDIEIIVHWQINGNSFLAALKDSKRLLYDNVKSIDKHGDIAVKYSLNDAGRDFRSCDQVISFAYVKGRYNFFVPGYIGADPNRGDFNCNYGSISFCKF